MPDEPATEDPTPEGETTPSAVSGTPADTTDLDIRGLDDLLPDQAALQDAQAAAHELFEIVDIRRVICVDDDFEGSVEDLKSACEALDPEHKITSFDNVSFDTPREIWGQAIDNRWLELTPTERGVALADAKEKAGLLDTDQLNAGALWSVLSDQVEFIALTPSQWISDEAQYLADAAAKPTLVLFDKELGGGHNGLDLVITLYAHDADRQVWAGLFTHTTDIANEHNVWAEHAQTSGVEADRFIVLSKQHLGPEPRSFPQALKVALMTRPASVLRRAVTDAIREQVNDALTALDELSPAEFERLVFGLTREEGQWEVDMLLRLFDTFLRSDVRQTLHANLEVRAAILLLRELADATTLPTADTTQAQQIYRRELYEEADHLNSLHLPIELGDVFTTSSRKNFVLVLQPCDLMVRSDGKRHPDIQNAGLVQILDTDPNAPPVSGEEHGAVAPATERKTLLPAFELPAFKDGESGWARLDRAYMIPIEALDYCVFDPDGKSKAPVVGNAPEWLLPGWQRRYEILASAAAQITNSLNRLNNNVSAENRKRIAASHFGRVRSPAAKIELTDANAVAFDLQRTARLRHPHARALLTRFTAHVARDAFERAIT